VICTQEVKRNVWLLTHDPAIVRLRWDVEHLTRPQLDYASIGKGGSGGSGHHEADVLDGASRLANGRAHVLRPPPTRLIGGSANGHTADSNELEAAFHHFTNLVGLIEALENDVGIHLVLAFCGRKGTQRSDSDCSPGMG
jgi:hypothetical protein